MLPDGSPIRHMPIQQLTTFWTTHESTCAPWIHMHTISEVNVAAPLRLRYEDSYSINAVRRFGPPKKPSRGLSREELRRIVLELIG
jgi:hypothetical protein